MKPKIPMSLVIMLNVMLFLCMYFFKTWSATDFLIILRSIPTYPNSQVLRVNAQTGFEDGQSGIMQFTSSDSNEMIKKYYLNLLQQKGWALDTIPRVTRFNLNKQDITFTKQVDSNHNYILSLSLVNSIKEFDVIQYDPNAK